MACGIRRVGDHDHFMYTVENQGTRPILVHSVRSWYQRNGYSYIGTGTGTGGKEPFLVPAERWLEQTVRLQPREQIGLVTHQLCFSPQRTNEWWKQAIMADDEARGRVIEFRVSHAAISRLQRVNTYLFHMCAPQSENDSGSPFTIIPPLPEVKPQQQGTELPVYG